MADYAALAEPHVSTNFVDKALANAAAASPKYSDAAHIRAERMARVMAAADGEDPNVTVAPQRAMQLTLRGHTVIPDNCTKLWQTYLRLAYALIDDERG